MFNDKSNFRNIKNKQFQHTAMHEFGHELAERYDLKLSQNKEERFADSVADYGMYSGKCISKDDISKNDTKEKQIMKGRHWTVTHKLHPMQSQLIHQAQASKDLIDFNDTRAYGRPIHLTRERNFKLDMNKGSRDMSSMGGVTTTPGTIMFTNDLSGWDSHYNNYDYDYKTKKDKYENSKEKDLTRPYVAVLDLSKAKLAKSLEDEGDYWPAHRGFGDEHYVRDVSKLSVSEFNTIEKERNKRQEFNEKFAPQNEDELKLLYALARNEDIKEVNKQPVWRYQKEVEIDTDSKDKMVYHGTTPMASMQIKTQGILTSKEIKDNGSPYFELSEKTNPSRTYFFNSKENAAMWAKLATENSMFPDGIPKVIEVDIPDNELLPDLEMPIPGAFYKQGHVKPSMIRGIYNVTEDQQAGLEKQQADQQAGLEKQQFQNQEYKEE
jgi:hypothetical protein